MDTTQYIIIIIIVMSGKLPSGVYIYSRNVITITALW